MDNDLGVVDLNPSVFIDNSDGWEFENNFFETAPPGAYGPTPWAANTFIKTTGDAETYVHHNHLGINPATATPIISMGGYQWFRFEDNNIASNGPALIEVIPPATYNGAFPILGTFRRNTGMASPRIPALLDDTADTMHLAYNSIPDPVNGGGLGGAMFNCGGTCYSFPWVFNVAANSYVIGAASTQGVLGWVNFSLANQAARKFRLRVTGMATAGGGNIQFDGHYLTAPVAITGATNASPIVIAAGRSYPTGTVLAIAGVLGNTAANGTYYVTFVDSTHFSLDGTTGSGAYTSGGTVLTANHTILSFVLCQVNAGTALSTTQLQTCESTLQVPAGDSGGGVVRVQLNLATAVIASIELIPVPESQAQVRVTSDSAIPITGTFQVGDLVLNSTAAIGGTAAWIATTAGTMNPIAATTHGTSTGPISFDIDGTGSQDHYLAEGQYITIAGVAGTRKIVSQVGLHVVVDTALGAAFAAALVSHSIGVFSTLNSFSGPPTGVAGGALAGTFPNPSIATVNAGPGVCGDATDVCTVTTNAAGQVTVQAATAITYPVSSVNSLTGAVNLLTKDLIAQNVQLTGQTVSIGPNNLTVGGGIAPAGFYRISAYLYTTVASGTDTILLAYNYNDGLAARTDNVGPTSLATLTRVEGQNVIYTNGAGHITYTVTRSAATGTPQWGVKIVLERIL